MKKMKVRKLNTTGKQRLQKSQARKITEEMKMHRMDLYFSFLCVLD